MKKLQAFLKRAQFCGFSSLTQVRVFLTLADMPGETTAKELAEVMGMDPTTISSVLRSLSDWTLVDLTKRTARVDDRNVTRIYARMSNTGRTSLDMLRMEVAP